MAEGEASGNCEAAVGACGAGSTNAHLGTVNEWLTSFNAHNWAVPLVSHPHVGSRVPADVMKSRTIVMSADCCGPVVREGVPQDCVYKREHFCDVFRIRCRTQDLTPTALPIVQISADQFAPYYADTS